MLAEEILDGRERLEVFKKQQSHTNVIEPTDTSLNDVGKGSEDDGIPMSPIQQPDLNTLSRVAKRWLRFWSILYFSYFQFFTQTLRTMNTPSRFSSRSPVPGSPTARNTPSAASNRLLETTSRLSGFNNDVEVEVSQRKNEEERKIQQFREAISRNERNLAMEIRKRQESSAALQLLMENQIQQLSERLTASINDKVTTLTGSIEALNERVGVCEAEIKDEKDAREHAVLEITARLTQRLDELDEALDSQRTSHVERDTAIMKKISDDISKVQNQLDAEKLARENSISHLRDDVESNLRLRAKAEDSFRVRVTEELEDVRTTVEQEKQSRETSEESFCKALDDVVSHVQSIIQKLSR
ncbi:hypothetical protein P9112_003805 [Eukaryota sp. TZLM1-RC]